ncbi:YcdB/YcdC domain-containing protein [Bacillus wiedmannii]|uniref:YcdB/YcdC domain-containing protein n=1 Tax=Bacillus wiedmannii TaxID=1890302 RepID=UPI000BF30D05|nr:YcdB/YcdC domain-containing protein [Bacillus wiedmannii]MBG9857570.1 cytoplasmic protein [Bacillus wiedmannii]MDM5269375.1 DUF4901 domain-containing protein [Bacillus wiedmannii]MEE3945623.1 YcdB/YcdC domain-containing protein [Bacillus wiedmannii]PFZ96545.1 DUF4901 domain-containing protein [Bacillus wiedmannii]HDR7352339.1 DUF4901 domain-containing protein [Bacillus wiedmannii]
MMNQKDKERKEQVAHMIDIPDDYRLVVDDQEGYEFYTYVTVKDDRGGRKEVNYMQEVNGYPLPNTGCVVQVHTSGNVVHFRYNGQKAIEKKPLWPSEIVEENVVLEKLKARQDMRLVFVDLTQSSCEYEYGEEVTGYHLVYEPEPSNAFINASTGEDLFGPEHYKLAPTVPVEKTVKSRQKKDVFDLLDWDVEKFIKVDEKEDEYEVRMKFVLKEAVQKEIEVKDPYSMNEFYKKNFPMLQHDKFVVITVDKKTNQLISCLMWTDEKDRKSILSREQCLEKALQFLEVIIPNATKYVQLWDDYESEEGIERFSFSIYVNGFCVAGKYIMLNINTENGAVMHYSGESSNFIKELLTYETTPKVTKEKALQIYKEAIRVNLEWDIDNDAEETVYKLLYKQTTDENCKEPFECSRDIRYIDAHTGEKIWSEY